MNEPLDVMRKRLHMRSIRRGIKEMDLILMGFSKVHLAGLDAAQLKIYDRMLNENDYELYQWVSGQSEEPPEYNVLMKMIREGAIGVTKPTA
jgi:antitoxin CptB